MLTRLMPGALLLIAIPSQSADIRDRLKRDLVVIEDGKMIIDDVRICSLKQATSQSNGQVVIRSRAPATGLVSRDRFVLMHGSLATALIGNANLTCKGSPEVIGTPDFSFSVVMQEAGIQIEIRRGENVERVTKLWSELD